MRSPGTLPGPVLLLEITGIGFLFLSYLSLHGYVLLPAPVDSAGAAIVMVFLGIALIVPAAALMVRAMAQNIAPLLTRGPLPEDKLPTDKIKEKRDDADH